MPELATLSEFPDPSDYGADVSRLRARLGHQPRDRTTVAGDLNLFSASHTVEEPGQMRLRLVSADGFHDTPPYHRPVDFA
jgi:hypothetical protein